MLTKAEEKKAQRILGFPPSEHQKKVFDFVLHGEGNAMISAVAGASKTSTSVTAMKMINSKLKCLFLAFNKSIASELGERLKSNSNCTAKTAHSLGFAMIRKNLGNEIEVDEYKYRTYLKKNISDLTTLDEDKVHLSRSQVGEYLDTISQLIDFGRLNLAQTPRELEKIADRYDIPYGYDECEVALKCMEWGKTNTQSIDYTDMLWLPVTLDMDPMNLRYDWVLVDEAQDMSLLSIALFQKCFKRGTRFLGVGDEKQCQPAGTMITMMDGSVKPIEEIQVGDKIVSYSGRRTCMFKGYKPTKRGQNQPQNSSYVNAIEHHLHEGEMIKVTLANGLVTHYTPEHICYSKLNDEKCGDKYCLYVMCNNMGMYRIGTTKVFIRSNSGMCPSFGLANRMRQERCDKGWLLGIYDTEKEARSNELYYSTLYQIPQVIFQQYRAYHGKRQEKQFWEDNDIIRMYQRLGHEYNMEEKVVELLTVFHRDIRFPMCECGDYEKRHGRYYASPIHACNIVNEIMDMVVFDPNHVRTRGRNDRKRGTIHHIGPTYVNVQNVEYYDTKEIVYSLDVETDHTYVADGIMTHNCINGFAGASPEAFQKMLNLPNTQLLELPITYRCARSIVDLAHQYVRDIFPRPDAPEGTISRNCHIGDIKDGDMVLARTKAPLFNLYTKLIKKGVNCYIKGNDIGKNLITLLQSFKQTKLNANLREDGVFIRLYDRMFTERNKLMYRRGLDVYDASLTAQIIELYDTINALRIIAHDTNSKYELMERIEGIFDEESNGVCLSTIHKAKGLEAKNVFILCHSAMSSKRATHDWEKQQEKNLIYVAYTRAKENLGFISEKEIPISGGSDDPLAIINDMRFCEKQVSTVLGKPMTEYVENIELSKFNIANNTSPMPEVGSDENMVSANQPDNPSDEVTTDTDNETDLLDELEGLTS